MDEFRRDKKNRLDMCDRSFSRQPIGVFFTSIEIIPFLLSVGGPSLRRSIILGARHTWIIHRLLNGARRYRLLDDILFGSITPGCLVASTGFVLV